MMINTLSRPVSTTVRQWEDAGVSLVTALEKYLALSLSLEENAISEGMPPKDLAARTDSALFWLQTFVDPNISRARSALARTRNRIMSPIYDLPREVLSAIFMNAIFGTSASPKPEPMEANVVRLYTTLHNILGVCRVWRDIALTEGAFWTIIPIFDFPSRTRAGKIRQSDAVLSRGIARSKGHLHLVATQPFNLPYGPIMVALAPRFRTVNISVKSRYAVRSVLEIFLSQSQLKRLSLSQLYIYQEQDEAYYCKLPKEKNYVLPRNSVEQGMFERLSQNLSSLRIRGAQFDWTRFTFTDQLTELHLQEVLFGHDLGQLLRAISAASGLRVLKFISTVAFYNGPPVYAPLEQSEIHLPNLQSLVITNLYFNTLDYILSSIASRSHGLTLLLTNKCRYADTAGLDTDIVDVAWEPFYELLRKVAVKNLLLERDVDDPWLPPSNLGELVKSVIRDLETLQINQWDFDTACCNVLASYSLSDGSASPSLTSLHITRARIHDYDAFSNMVLSHSGSIQRMVFGGVIRGFTGKAFEWVTLHGPVVFTPILSLPDFQLVEPDFKPPDFIQAPWQLW